MTKGMPERMSAAPDPNGRRTRRVLVGLRGDNLRTMNYDTQLFDQINALSEEEEQLYQQAGDGHGLTEVERSRLRQIRVELDRMYDLLHQRDARRAIGQDPAEAKLRPAEIVEKYDQ